MSERIGSNRLEAFEIFRKAWFAGRAIVPVFGAGMSVPAAIPTTPEIVNYLVKLRYLGRLDKVVDCADQVALKGWPSRHQLTADVMAKHDFFYPAASEGKVAIQPQNLLGALTRTHDELLVAAIHSELRRDHPTAAKVLGSFLAGLGGTPPARAVFLNRLIASSTHDSTSSELEWSPLLRLSSGGQQSLVDAFFDRLIRGRRPAMSHQYVAYLTKFLRWNPIVTTNFDELFEVALRDEGLAPVVYELFQGTSPPDPRLIASHLSVLKIHGGSYGLRAGFELNDPIDDATAAFFDRCIPKDALLLVVGHGGTDSRLMALLSYLTAGAGQGRRVAWVHRGKLEKRHLPETLGRHTKLIEAGDGGLFLEELYSRLTMSHPAGQDPYRVLSHVPELPHTPPLPDDHPRVELLRRYRNSPAWVKTWFNLYEVDSLATFLTMIADFVRVYDRDFPPRVLSPVVTFPEDPRDANRFREAVRPWCMRLASALRRGRYLLAIDAMGAFSNDHPAWMPDAPAEQKRLRDQFIQFVEELVAVGKTNRASERDWPIEPHQMPVDTCFGESRIIVATDFDQLRPKPGSPADDEGAVQVLHGSWRAEEGQAGDREDPRRIDQLREAVIDAAASFRRPRSVVGLVRVATRILAMRDRIKETHNPKLAPERCVLRRIAAENGELYEQLEKRIAELADEGVLQPLDGGFYAMAFEVRNRLYETIAVSEPGPKRRKDLADIQDFIADYYRTGVYEQSNDIAAYLEYIFHRTASISLQDDPKLKLEWLRWLLGSLKRERSLLIGRGHASAAVHATRRLRGFIEQLIEADFDKSVEGARVDLQAKLDQLERMEYEIWRDVTNYRDCEEYFAKQLRKQLKLTDEGAPAGYEDIVAAISSSVATVKGCDPAGPHAIEAVMTATQAIETVVSLSECIIGPHVTKHPSLDLAEALLRETLNLTDAIIDLRGKCEGPEGEGDFLLDTDQTRDLEVATLHQLIETRLRRTNPWTGDKEWSDRDADEVDGWVRRAISRLRVGALGAFSRRMQCRIRCQRARSFQHSGRFGRANEELNRAHAFTTRFRGPDGSTVGAIYHLYRAEYCLVFARSERRTHDLPGDPEKQWLLSSSRTALEQAEGLLAKGRREVFWWVRLFILKARLELETIRSALSAPIDGPASSDADGDLESRFVRALNAIAGGLANSYFNEEREAILDLTWDQLEAQFVASCGSTAGPQAWSGERLHSRQQWWLLNERVGIGWYWKRRKTRRPASKAGIVVVNVSSGQELPVRDFTDHGFGVHHELELGQDAKLTLRIEGAIHVDPLSCTVVGRGREAPQAWYGLRIDDLRFEQRLAMRRYCAVADATEDPATPFSPP